MGSGLKSYSRRRQIYPLHLTCSFKDNFGGGGCQALHHSIHHLFHRCPCSYPVNIIAFQWTLNPPRKRTRVSCPYTISLILNLLTRKFFHPPRLYSELSGTVQLLMPACSPSFSIGQGRYSLPVAAAEQWVQLTWHIKTDFFHWPQMPIQSVPGQVRIRLKQ